MDGCQRQNPAYRSATERPRFGGAFLLASRVMTSMRWGAPAEFPAIYEELNVPAFFSAFADELLERAAPRDGERILDVATGTGIVLRRAREGCPELARAVGLDLTPAMLAVAREKADGLAIEFVEGDARELPFADAGFDIVTCQQGLQFFPERERALREFRRMLAPGGRAGVACWCELDSAPAQRAITAAVVERFPEHESVARAPWALDDAEELRGLLHGAGFREVDVERVECVARFASPEDVARGYIEGSPFALAMAEVAPEESDALLRDIADRVRELVGEPVKAPMVTHIATARA